MFLQMDKKIYVGDLGEFLTNHGTKMSVPELARHLNRNNFKTNYGEEYKGERGTFTLVEAVYNELVKAGNQIKADKVAKAFPKDDGSYAY